MKNIKFNELTKKTSKNQVNLLTGKRIKIKKKLIGKDKEEVIIDTTDINFTPLNTEISKKYEGKSANIAGVIDELPEVLKTFVKNAQLTRVITNPCKTIFVLDNTFTFVVEEVKLGKHNKHYVTIKQGKQVLLRKHI